jgi:hypothetical protein
MLSSLLRSKKGHRHVEHSPFSSRYGEQCSPTAARKKRLHVQHATADFSETELDDESTEEEEDEADREGGDRDSDNDEDGQEDAPLLPIFSAAHLGDIIYVSHATIC